MAVNNLGPTFPTTIACNYLTVPHPMPPVLAFLLFLKVERIIYTSGALIFHSFCMGSFNHILHLDYSLPSFEFQLKECECTEAFLSVSLHPELPFYSTHTTMVTFIYVILHVYSLTQPLPLSLRIHLTGTFWIPQSLIESPEFIVFNN